MAQIDQSDSDEEQIILVKKEIELLNTQINEVIGGGYDCQFKYELEQSEMARNHLAIIYEQQ